MRSLRKILEAIGEANSRTGYYPFGPWVYMVRPPMTPSKRDDR